MLNHVDIEFVTPLIGGPLGDVWSRRRPARPRIQISFSRCDSDEHGRGQRSIAGFHTDDHTKWFLVPSNHFTLQEAQPCSRIITLWTTKWQNALFCHTRFLFFSVVLIGKEACSTSVEWCPPLSRPGRRRCCRPPAGLRPRRAVWLAQLRIAQWRCPAQAARF
jgi:hypothetical protein